MFNWIKSKKSLTLNQTSKIESFVVSLFAVWICLSNIISSDYSKVNMMAHVVFICMVVFIIYFYFKCRIENKMKVYDALYFISIYLIMNIFFYCLQFCKNWLTEVKLNEENNIYNIILCQLLYNSFIIFINILGWNYKKIDYSGFWSLKKLYYKLIELFSLCKLSKYYYRHKFVIASVILFITMYLTRIFDSYWNTIVYCLITQLIMLICRPNLYLGDISITQNNLDLGDIKKGNLYSLDDHGILGKSSIIKVDMSDFMNYDDCCVVLSNLKCSNNLRNAVKYFYLAIPEKFNKDFVQIKAYIIQKDENAEKFIKSINFMLEIRTIDSFKFVISRYINKNYKLKFFKKNLLKEMPSFPNFINFNEIECKYEHLFINLYKFNDNDIKQFKDLVISDKRKFILHNDRLGVGKTTYDMNFIMAQGYLPIVISSWEDNYDHDFLYYIFTRVKEETKTYSHPTLKSISIFYVTLLSSILTLYLVNRDRILQMISQPVWNFFESVSSIIYFSFFKYEIITILLFVFLISFVLYALFNHSIVIFKKDYSKIYQTFFLTEIYKMITLHGKILLLIEDADRLSVNAFDNVIRTLSSINKKFMKYDKILGILSIDVNDIEYKLRKAKMILGCDMDDINNKIICSEIGRDYNAKECMELYLIDIFTFIKNKNSESAYIALSELEKERIENYITKDINFRDVLELINKMIKNYSNISGIGKALEYLES